MADLVTPTLRVALAQTVVAPDVPTADVIDAARQRVRAQVAEASAAGARLVCFPEGTLTYPSKRLMSRVGPDLGEADWGRCDWDALDHALGDVRDAAAAHGIWVVVGAPHRDGERSRPRNSLHVIADDGSVPARYDKRFLSTNEAAYLYGRGKEPVVVEIDDVRIGFLLCLETLFPELFMAYAALGADLVLIASAPDRNFGMLARAHAFLNGLHVGIAFGASDDPDDGRSGLCSMHGWLAQADTTAPTLVVGDVTPQRGTHEFQRKARSGELYAGLD